MLYAKPFQYANGHAAGRVVPLYNGKLNHALAWDKAAVFVPLNIAVHKLRHQLMRYHLYYRRADMAPERKVIL